MKNYQMNSKENWMKNKRNFYQKEKNSLKNYIVQISILKNLNNMQKNVVYKSMMLFNKEDKVLIIKID